MQRELITYGLVDIIGLGIIGAGSAQTFNLRFAHRLSKGPFLDVKEAFAKRGQAEAAQDPSRSLTRDDQEIMPAAASLSYLRRN